VPAAEAAAFAAGVGVAVSPRSARAQQTRAEQPDSTELSCSVQADKDDVVQKSGDLVIEAGKKVKDAIALADTALLLLERGWQSDWGNTVRIYRVDLADPGLGGADVLASAGLDADTPVLAKTLVVDLGALRVEGVTHPGTQANPLLDNYEGLAVGPVLPDGRRVLFVTSDDNANHATQVARVLVLAVPGL